MDNPRGPAKGSFLQPPPSLLSGLRARLIKLHPQNAETALSLVRPQQLRALISAWELTDTGEAGLGRRPRDPSCARCAVRARRKHRAAIDVPHGLNQPIPGELRVRRGALSWDAFAKYPKARQAP